MVFVHFHYIYIYIYIYIYARMNSYVTFSCGAHHMVVPVLADRHELTNKSSMRTHDVVCKNYRERWTIARGENQENLCTQRDLTRIIYHHHHHHVVPPARISRTLSRHFSLSFIASGRSSELNPVSSHSCCMCVRAGRATFAWPYVGVHSTSLMSSSLLLQQCPACLVRLAWIVFVMGSRWPYSWCLVGCCFQDLFNIARSILV